MGDEQVYYVLKISEKVLPRRFADLADAYADKVELGIDSAKIYKVTWTEELVDGCNQVCNLAT